MDDDALRAMFAGLRGEERRVRRPPPDGQGGLLLGEGARVVQRCLDAGHHLRALLVSTAYNGPLPSPAVPTLRLDPEEIQRLTGFGAMREMLGAFDRPPDPAAADVLPGARRVLVLEGVMNPSNVGTIIRSATALGVDATLIGPGSADPFGRRALRTSMGAALVHPWAITADPLADLTSAGFALLALTPDEQAAPLHTAITRHAGDRVALLLGAEGPGLTDAVLAAADERVTIPMAPGVDSLNVAAAAAIACWVLASGGQARE
ncbi:MAG: RNA methyltransferase [Acidobacteria bacterium]|nr:RNA methyltransferase [Acidobacteriota bacterium]